MTANRRRRYRSSAVTLGMTALLAACLTGCSQDEEATHEGVCVDQATQQRVDDSKCGHDEDHYFGYYGGYGWWYYPYGYAYPPLGGRVTSYPGGIDSSSSTARSTVGTKFAPAVGAAAAGGTLSKGGGGGSRGFGG